MSGADSDDDSASLLVEAIDVQSDTAWPVHCALRAANVRAELVLPVGTEKHRFVIACKSKDDAKRLLAIQRRDCKFQCASVDAQTVVSAERRVKNDDKKPPQRSNLNVPATKRMIGVALKNHALIAQANQELRQAQKSNGTDRTRDAAAPAAQIVNHNISSSSTSTTSISSTNNVTSEQNSSNDESPATTGTHGRVERVHGTSCGDEKRC